MTISKIAENPEKSRKIEEKILKNLSKNFFLSKFRIENLQIYSGTFFVPNFWAQIL